MVAKVLPPPLRSHDAVPRATAAKMLIDFRGGRDTYEMALEYDVHESTVYSALQRAREREDRARLSVS